MTEFDYIVVGAGSAGSVVAARLSEDSGVRVLLLEAGDDEQTRALTVPNAWPDLIGTSADWAYTTTSQADAGPVPYPRGRVLGGSGAINAMAHLRGHRAIYDGWGVPGWGFTDLLPYFKRSEQAVGRDPALRGTAGPVRVAPVPPDERHPVATTFAEALCRMGCPETDDLSGARQEGVAWPDLAIADGRRVSPADAYLRPALHRENLVLETGSLVTGLLVRQGRCTGVSMIRAGTPAAATAGEVILCAGAVGSPQLLLLSGVGPADQLRALGIEPAADLAGVGENLQDHPMVMASFAAGQLPASQYNHGETYSALRSPLAVDYPDLHLFPILLPLAPPGGKPPESGFVLVAAVVAADSRGSVRLVSSDPAAAPLIDPGLLRDERDTDRLAAGFDVIREAAEGPVFSGAFSDARPVVAWQRPERLRGYIRGTVGSYWHPAGTCRMGQDSDPGSVVDPLLRVRGLTGLRVADASVLPVLPNAHPNATVLAVAEKAADIISGRSRSTSETRLVS